MSKQPNPPPPGDKPAGTAPPPPPRWRLWLWPIAIGITFVLYIFLPGINVSTPVSLSYSRFISDAGAHKIKTVVFGNGASGSNTTATGDLTSGKTYTTVIPGQPTTALSQQLSADGVKSVTASPPSSGLGTDLLYWLFLLLPVIYVFWLLRRTSRAGGGAGGLQGVLGVGRSRATVFDAERPQTKFSDVAGYEGVKAEIGEVIDFLRSPGRYQRAGAVAPRGLLMIGPPGTGKTLLARAVAGEASVPFFSVTGSSFVEMFVGVGAARVRDLFSEARKRAPAIIFIDEIDAIGQRRSGSGAGATDLATKMVREYGLSPKLGPVGYPEGGSVFLGGGGPGMSSRPFAEATQAAIDGEVARLLREAEQTAVGLLRSHRHELDQLVALLLEHETVDGSAVYRIIGKPEPGHRPRGLAIAPHASSVSRPAAGGGSAPPPDGTG